MDITDDERSTIGEMMAKGTYAVLLLTAAADLDGTFERVQARGAAGNLIRIQELR